MRAKGPTAKLLYVTGARQGAPVLPHAAKGYEAHYDCAVICRIDIPSKSVDKVVEYRTPADRSPDERPAILFKTATLENGLLYVPTQTEVLVYRVPTFAQVGYVSISMLNDVHHARPTPRGGVVVANTGLDMVAELALDGSVIREWNVAEVATWERFSRTTDYRKLPSTKPHFAHPNNVFFLGDELWVTRFEQRDAISLTQPGRRIDIGGERVHDGVVHGDQIYFTNVDGQVRIAGMKSLAVESIIDLKEFYPPDTLLGWTRGIAVDAQGFWVAFSRIRHTRFRENVGWLRRGFRQIPPTRVAYFDLSSRTVGPSFEVESAGVNTLFSVLIAE